MYNKVLVISDNVFLCKKFLKIVSDLKFNDVEWSFAISPFSNPADFLKEINKNIYVYDLKDNKDIEVILKKYDLIFSIHCKQIFPPILVDNIKCINVHPGYNPINRGWYPQVFSIIHDLPIGATIHEIDNDLDHGNIIARAFVKKEITDTSLSLYNKVVDKEIELIRENLTSIIKSTYELTKPENEGNVYLKKDFNSLCKLDLEEKVTVFELINKLRALSHGKFKNAYFIDKETQKKVFVNVNLEIED